MRRVPLALLTFVLLLALGSYGARREPDLQDDKLFQKRNWLQFSTRVADGRASAVSITRDNIDLLRLEWTIALPEIVDSAPLYASDVVTEHGPRDLVILETTVGRVVAYDARDGKMVWHTEPPPGPRWTA